MSANGNPYRWTHESLFRWFGHAAGPDTTCRGVLGILGFAFEAGAPPRPGAGTRLVREFVFQCPACRRFLFAVPGRRVWSRPVSACCRPGRARKSEGKGGIEGGA